MTKRFENQYFIFGALLLAAGDILALLLLSFFGTMEHQLDSSLPDIWNMTVPFIVAWILIGILLEAYRIKAYSSLPGAAATAVKTAVLSAPIGLLLRWFMYDKPASWGSGLLTFIFIALFLVLWRCAYAWLIRNI